MWSFAVSDIIDPINNNLDGDINEKACIEYNGIKDNIMHLSIKFLDVEGCVVHDINFRNNMTESLRNDLQI